MQEAGFVCNIFYWTESIIGKGVRKEGHFRHLSQLQTQSNKNITKPNIHWEEDSGHPSCFCLVLVCCAVNLFGGCEGCSYNALKYAQNCMEHFKAWETWKMLRTGNVRLTLSLLGIQFDSSGWILLNPSEVTKGSEEYPVKWLSRGLFSISLLYAYYS